MPEQNPEIAKAIQSLATHVKYLGVGDSGTSMGAIEFLATSIADSNKEIAAAIHDLAEAVRHQGE